MDTLGERIVYLRKAKNLKQYELEEMLAVTT